MMFEAFSTKYDSRENFIIIQAPKTRKEKAGEEQGDHIYTPFYEANIMLAKSKSSKKSMNKENSIPVVSLMNKDENLQINVSKLQTESHNVYLEISISFLESLQIIFVFSLEHLTNLH